MRLLSFQALILCFRAPLCRTAVLTSATLNELVSVCLFHYCGCEQNGSPEQFLHVIVQRPLFNCRPGMSNIPAVPVSRDELPVNSWQGRCTCWWTLSSASSHTVLWVGGPLHCVCIGRGGLEGAWAATIVKDKWEGCFITQISSTRHLYIHHCSTFLSKAPLDQSPLNPSLNLSWK